MVNMILSINNHQVIKNYIFSACKKKYKLSFLYWGLKGLLRQMSRTIIQICDLSDTSLIIVMP